MNSALVSPAKKALNRQQRRRRDARSRTRNRRQAQIEKRVLRSSFSSAWVASATGAEATVIFAGNMSAAKPVIERVLRRHITLIRGGKLRPASEVPGSRMEVARPSRHTAMPRLHPWLVNSEPVAEAVSIKAGLMKAAQDRAAGMHDYAIVDLFQSATRLDWKTAREFLCSGGLLNGHVDDETLDVMRGARLFWRSWEHARLAYRAAIHLGQIRPASGDWGLVDLGDMPRVFPGLRLPKAELRSTFAVRLVRETVGVAADFHAISYRPLFSVKV